MLICKHQTADRGKFSISRLKTNSNSLIELLIKHDQNQRSSCIWSMMVMMNDDQAATFRAHALNSLFRCIFRFYLGTIYGSTYSTLNFFAVG